MAISRQLSHGTRHQNGGADEIATAIPVANAIPKAEGSAKLNAGWIPTSGFVLTYPSRISTADPNPEVAGDYTLICNRATPMGVPLLAATGSLRVLQIANINVAPVTIIPGPGDTINGETTQQVSPGNCMNIKDYAAGKWVII